MEDKCARQGCEHDTTDHPNNGGCIKCTCVGFFRNSQVTNPLQNKYIQDTINIKTRFDSTLDMADHLNANFSKMAKDFFVIQDKKNDEFYKKLHDEDLETWTNLKDVLDKYNKIGRTALDGTPVKVLNAISIMMHDGANYQLSLSFVEEMILSYILIMFRTFLKDTVKIMFERDHISMATWNGMTVDEREQKAAYLADQDAGEMASDLKKNFGIDLKKEKDCNDFKERFYRRHMYQHNEGFPNKKYKDKVNNKVPDTKLIIDKDYLTKTIVLFRRYAELIEEFCLEKYMGVVNINKKSNVVRIDLTQGGGQIIPIEDNKGTP